MYFLHSSCILCLLPQLLLRFYSQMKPYVPKAIIALTFLWFHTNAFENILNITEALWTRILWNAPDFLGNLAYSLHFKSFYSQHIFQLHYYILFFLSKIFFEFQKLQMQEQALLAMWSLAWLFWFLLSFYGIGMHEPKVHKIKVLNQCASNYQGGTGNCDVIGRPS